MCLKTICTLFSYIVQRRSWKNILYTVENLLSLFIFREYWEKMRWLLLLSQETTDRWGPVLAWLLSYVRAEMVKGPAWSRPGECTQHPSLALPASSGWAKIYQSDTTDSRVSFIVCSLVRNSSIRTWENGQQRFLIKSPLEVFLPQGFYKSG